MQHVVTIVENATAVWLLPHVELQVVGESYNGPHLQRLIAEGKHLVGLQLVAWLTPEPSNEHDPNAVMVWISGGEVGHLAREDAALWQPILLQLTAHYRAPIACLAEIRGGDYPSAWLRVPYDAPRGADEDTRRREWFAEKNARVGRHHRIEADRRAGILGTQTEVGRPLGLSARAVGKILDRHSLRERVPVHVEDHDEPLMLPRGVAEGYAICDDYTGRVYWIAERVRPLLEST